MSNDLFTKICAMLQLGYLQAPVQRVEGGYLHQMYRLETDSGRYALKLLNPLIMQRAAAMKNYQCAEKLERKLEVAGIPIVPARTFHHQKMQYLDGQYFYVFDWIDGSAVPHDQITIDHCQKIGRLLGQIHGIEHHLHIPRLSPLKIDWHAYTLLAKEMKSPIVRGLEENESLFERLQERGNAAFELLPDIGCICHGDMDVKNVLWQNGEPRVIDLECLAISNPYIEILTLALSWSGYEQEKLDQGQFKVFMEAYQKENDLPAIDSWILYDANTGFLDWLAYNIRRALMLEAGSEAEKQLGIEQTFQTIRQIRYYDRIKPALLDLLDECALRKY